MNMRPCTAITVLVFSVALSSVSAFAQNGPAAVNFGATSNPQTGGQPYGAQPAAAAKGRSVYDVAPQQPGNETSGPNGPAGANFGATSSPQTGGKPYSPQTAAKGQPVYDVVSRQPGQTLGPNGPAGANYGATSNPQTGK